MRNEFKHILEVHSYLRQFALVFPIRPRQTVYRDLWYRTR